ncbi:hypothetical protein GCM10022403_073880 [Streptomyces coacervatus]|uniref:Uncharacterized protein n=1 Tax=Streptomyces coacervatus TaxID=647381 RepID=A0ABP7IXZ9_9ACTN|nr:hypothetical protein [Streptomyces coacervatus]MDF2270173.1 hypothetical protein [Streptomyces coacervatus]
MTDPNELLPARGRLPFEQVVNAVGDGWARREGPVDGTQSSGGRSPLRVGSALKGRGELRDQPRWCRRRSTPHRRTSRGRVAHFGALLRQLWAVRHNPAASDPAATRTARRCLAATDGLPDAPTAQAAYDLLRPHF